MPWRVAPGGSAGASVTPQPAPAGAMAIRSLPRRLVALVVLIPLLLSACATLPTGPSVMVLPGTGRPFEEFQIDDASCRQWAHQQTGATAGDAQARSGVA